MDFKRQTNRSTREDRTTNINIFLKNFEIGVVESKYWGDFSELNKNDPLIEFKLDGKDYRMRLNKFKELLRRGLKGMMQDD